MDMEPTTFLVRKKSLNTEALLIQATGFLCCRHITDQIQWLLIPLGPTTQHHNRTIYLSCDMDVLELNQAAWLETRPQGIKAKRRAVPRRCRAHGRAAYVGPARLMERGLESRPVELAVAQKDDRGPLGDHLAHQFDHGDVEVFRKVALRGLAHPPSQRQGSTFIDDMDHQRATPAAYAAPIHDKHHRLQGEMTQQDVCIGQKVYFLKDMSIVAPPGKAFDPALGLGAVGDLGGDVGQLRALTVHDATNKRGEGGQVPGDRPRGLARISL